MFNCLALGLGMLGLVRTNFKVCVRKPLLPKVSSEMIIMASLMFVLLFILCCERTQCVLCHYALESEFGIA